ncbi:MAG: hypothetical protein O3B01_19985 [Planctomycetota bacterium]|nr:hypothetical protein [Planctomycetota bacterium]MDA1140851.1 hypothetical protein [Planctomycetota bacterium]
MTVRELNAEKKLLSCLKCGKAFKTDRCHRTCTRCKKAMFRYNEGIRPVYVYSYGAGSDEDFAADARSDSTLSVDAMTVEV